MSNDTPDKKLHEKRQSFRLSRRNMLLTGTSILAAAGLQSAAPIMTAQAQQAAGAGSPPNILVIMADDVGYWNISAYNQGMMGYRTPNIDRIGREVLCLPTITASSLAPPVGLRSSPDSRHFGPA